MRSVARVIYAFSVLAWVQGLTLLTGLRYDPEQVTFLICKMKLPF